MYIKISIFKYTCVKIPIGLQRHVGLRWVSTGMSVSDGACQSQMGQVGRCWGMSVSDEACRLRSNMWVFDRSPIIIIFW